MGVLYVSDVFSANWPKDELGVISVPREAGKFTVIWPTDEAGVIVIPQEAGELLHRVEFDVGAALVGRVAAEEGVPQALPCS